MSKQTPPHCMTTRGPVGEPHKAAGSAPPPKRCPSGSFPAIRLVETRERVTVIAVVPGFAEGDLEVTLNKDVLRIAGRLQTQVPGGFISRHQGRQASDFRRELKLATDVTWSDNDAQLTRGVLTIHLRKDVPSSRPPIPIRLT